MNGGQGRLEFLTRSRQSVIRHFPGDWRNSASSCLVALSTARFASSIAFVAWSSSSAAPRARRFAISDIAVAFLNHCSASHLCFSASFISRSAFSCAVSKRSALDRASTSAFFASCNKAFAAAIFS